MAKKKSTPKEKPAQAQKSLTFYPEFKGKVMCGKIEGIDLPKKYEDFTEAEKEALYDFNPYRAKFYFEGDISHMENKTHTDLPKKPELDATESESEDTE